MSPIYGDDSAWLQRQVESRGERRRPAREPRAADATTIIAVGLAVSAFVAYCVLWGLG